MANKEINPDTWDEYDGSGTDAETIENRERGCGYLKAGNSYIRCDPSAFSEGGTLPGFVAFVDSNGDLHPIPFKESLPRGYETVDGTNFLAAAETERNLACLYPGDPDAEQSHQEAHQEAKKNMVGTGLYDTIEEVPASELARHLDRMAHDGFDGREHWGEITPANSQDLMMRVGKSYYDEPWDFIDETLELGLNKGISVHSNKSPPTIQPGRTRCWLIHPHACGEDMPGVIGFCYLTRCIFTRDKDGNVPKYAQNYADAGELDVVDIGEPQPREEDEEREGEDVAEGHQTLDNFEAGAREVGSEPTEAADTPDIEAAEPSHAPQEMAELGKVDLGELAGEGWVEAEQPPEEHDVLADGGLVGIVQQNGSPRKVAASNNFTFDSQIQTGSTTLGPYMVELTFRDGNRMVRVTER